MLTQVVSGFDLEIGLTGAAVRHVLQLLMDTGEIPREVEEDGFAATLRALAGTRRTYGAFPGAAYDEESTDAFEFQILDFTDTHPEHVYLAVAIDIGVPAAPNAVLRLPQQLDVAATIGWLLADIDGQLPEDTPPFDIRSLMEIVAISTDLATFDPDDPLASTADLFRPLVAMLNGGIDDFVQSLRDGDEPQIVESLREQLDPFALLTLRDLAFARLGEDRLAILVNLNLLAPVRGHLGDRGDPAAAQDFLPDGVDLAIACSPDFTARLADSLVLRAVTGMAVEAELMELADAVSILDDRHYPLVVPDALLLGDKVIEVEVEEEDDTSTDDGEEGAEDDEPEEPVVEEISVPRETVAVLQILGTSVSTTKHRFRTKDGSSERRTALKVTLKINASAINLLGFADENLVLFAAPIEREVDGITVADIAIDTNLRMDVLRTVGTTLRNLALGTLAPVTTLSLLAPAATAIVNLFAAKPLDDAFGGELFADFGLEPLAWLPLITRRWDYFFESQHGLLLERQRLRFEEDRLLFAASVHLSRRPIPFPGVYVRDLVTEDDGGLRILRLLYGVNSIGLTRADDQFATDRLPAEHLEDDRDPRIVALPFAGTEAGNALARIADDRLAPMLPYAPYCIRRDRHRDDGDHTIDRIGVYSTVERSNLRSSLRNAWLDAKARSLADAIAQTLDVDMDEEQFEELAAVIRPVFEDSQELQAYMRDDVEDDIATALRAPGTIRLRPPPHLLRDLMQARVLDLVGYQAVVRENTVYVRDVPDGVVEDNLLSLPECPAELPPEEEEDRPSRS